MVTAFLFRITDCLMSKLLLRCVRSGRPTCCWVACCCWVAWAVTCFAGKQAEQAETVGFCFRGKKWEFEFVNDFIIKTLNNNKITTWTIALYCVIVLSCVDIYYLWILSLNLLEDFYSISFYLWYSFVCCKDVLTQSKFANTVMFTTLLAATVLSAIWFLSYIKNNVFSVLIDM